MEFDFGSLSDKKYDFEDKKSIRDFVKSNMNQWQQFFDKYNVAGQTNIINSILEPWLLLTRDSELNIGEEINSYLADRIKTISENNKVIPFESKSGSIIKEIIVGENYELCENVLNYLKQRKNSPLSLFGSAILYELSSHGLTPELLKNTKDVFWDRISKLDENIKIFDNQIITANQNLNALEKTYEEKLKLSAPAKYWRNKIINHNNKRENILFIIFLYLMFSAIIAAGFHDDFFIFADEANSFLFRGIIVENMDANKTNTIVLGRLFLLAFSTIFVSTLFFWPLRHLVRMLLSEEHLGSDATYKDALLMTYLALLKKDGINQDKDRQIALEAIFKQPQDGLVKDDGLPNWMPSAWFNKIK